MGYITFAHSSWGPKYKAKGFACQDYSDKQNLDDVQIIAVADGHGSNDCFRSNIGSELAVKIAFEMISEYEVEGCFSSDNNGQQYLDSINAEMKELPIIQDGLEGQEYSLCEIKAPSVDYNSWLQKRQNIYSAMSDKAKNRNSNNYSSGFIRFSEDGIKSFKYQFWKRWRAAVKKDWDSKLSIYIKECKYNYGDNYKLEDLNNIIEKHESRFQKVSNKYKDRYLTKEADKYLYTAYGTTFLLVLSIESQILLLQIGDGTCVVMQRNGTFSVPVPADENNRLNVTVSLCEEDAYKKIRHAILDNDVPELAPVAVFLSSDGLDDCYPVYHNDKYLYRLYYEILKKLSTDSSAKALDELKQEIKDSLLPNMTFRVSQDDISLAFLVDDDINALREALARVSLNDVNPDYEDESEHKKIIENDNYPQSFANERKSTDKIQKLKITGNAMFRAAEDCRRIGSYSSAFGAYVEACSQGNPFAYYWIGWCYENGRGVKADSVRACEYYEKAFREIDNAGVTADIIDSNFSDCKSRSYAQYVLGWYYEKRGNRDKAQDCYRSALELGYEEAQDKLNSMILENKQTEEAERYAKHEHTEYRCKPDDIVANKVANESWGRETADEQKLQSRRIGKKRRTLTTNSQTKRGCCRRFKSHQRFILVRYKKSYRRVTIRCYEYIPSKS